MVTNGSGFTDKMQVNVFLITIGLYLLIIYAIVRPMARRSAAVKRHAKEIMRGRPKRTAVGFSNLFPGNLRPVAIGVWQALKDNLIVDYRRINPADRLFADLGLAQVDGLDVDHLNGDIESRFGVSVLKFLDENDPTVNDLVEYIARDFQAKNVVSSNDRK